MYTEFQKVHAAEEICSNRLYSFRDTVKHMHEYYAQHNKMEKFITQLRHASVTHRERRNTVKYPNIS